MKLYCTLLMSHVQVQIVMYFSEWLDLEAMEEPSKIRIFPIICYTP